MSEKVEIYVKKAGVDFTRKRKLPFENVIQLLISMGGNSIYKELLKASGYDLNTATTSAFIQQREKILPCAFEHLLHEFTNSQPALKKHRGYRLFAADGSDLHFATNPDDTQTYTRSTETSKGVNLIHVNALYDLCNRLYIDTLIQPLRQLNEKKALVDMVDRSAVNDKAIILADRNYESYNIFEHIKQKGWNYLIRVKDIDSNGILSGLKLPAEEEFDVVVERLLTRRQTKHIKANPDIYRFLPSNVNFDFLPVKSKDFFPVALRVVRIKISENTYQTIITSLKQNEFSADEIKKLYAMRWGIETSFRNLKYTVGLVQFHAKKREFIVQEIFARIIMYNFTEMITSHVVISMTHTKHDYQVNFSVAVSVCRHFLRLLYYEPPPDVEALIRMNILPVRHNRHYSRKFHQKSAVCFIYRLA